MSLQHMVEQQQAAARGAVVTGAERQCRLDLDTELVGRYLCAVVVAVHDETSGMHRHQFLERAPAPVLPSPRVEGDTPRAAAARGDADQFAERGLIRRL